MKDRIITVSGLVSQSKLNTFEKADDDITTFMLMGKEPAQHDSRWIVEKFRWRVYIFYFFKVRNGSDIGYCHTCKPCAPWFALWEPPSIYCQLFVLKQRHGLEKPKNVDTTLLEIARVPYQAVQNLPADVVCGTRTILKMTKPYLLNYCILNGPKHPCEIMYVES